MKPPGTLGGPCIQHGFRVEKFTADGQLCGMCEIVAAAKKVGPPSGNEPGLTYAELYEALTARGWV